MNILHVVSGSLTAGAARGALWLHHGLIKLGAQSRIITTHNDVVETDIYPIYSNSKFGRLLRKFRLACDVLPAYLYPKRQRRLFSSALTGFKLTSHPLYAWTDIIHLHWINAGMLSLSEISKIEKPVVWTLRDMWPFTGGCHYSLECENFKTGCGKCPLLGSSKTNDLSSINFKRKQKALPMHLKAVAISNWLKQCAQQSSIFNGHEISVIHNCVDTADFYPVAQSEARKKLGWAENDKIILGGAFGLSSLWKGFDCLIAAMKKFGSDYKLALFGDTHNIPNEWRELLTYDLGQISKTSELSLLYSAADVFVAPSRQEAFGKTLTEAMSNCTPVVGFNATGPADILTHKKTGYLAQPFESDDLARGIEWCCENNSGNTLGLAARERVISHFSPPVIAEKYFTLYQNELR